MSVNEAFRKLAHRSSEALGSPWAFATAVLVVVLWAATGPVFAFSETWQLVINTGTTIVTFLMVFLIQNTQNRDLRALHLKLDELLRGVEGARNSLIDLEDLSDLELERLAREFHELQQHGEGDKARAAAIRKELEDRKEASGSDRPSPG
ncbi:MAG TPA: low affinity iron permease family protein [Nannocystaceae bacterium]|nr:low affinity iron permease family protein [Nannocystaceae bacterium]